MSYTDDDLKTRMLSGACSPMRIAKTLRLCADPEQLSRVLALMDSPDRQAWHDGLLTQLPAGTVLSRTIV